MSFRDSKVYKKQKYYSKQDIHDNGQLGPVTSGGKVKIAIESKNFVSVAKENR